jgi:hypothetical protein
MAETGKNPQADQAPDKTSPVDQPGHRHEHKERVFEDGRDAQNNPRPSRENLSGTPLGSDPRE